SIFSRLSSLVPSLVLALLLAGLMAIPALAGPRGGGFRFLRHLDLTETQKTEIRTILDTHRSDEAVQDLRNNLQNARQAARDAVRSETFDESAVRNAHKTAAGYAEEMAVHRAKVYSEINAVLTPEQREQLKSLPERGPKGRGMGRGKGRGTRHGRGWGDGAAWDDDLESDFL
ncbi:MAG: Spy/CpxP family protein refolding chaperone, partial [Thermodesulfobacteriota bacterium]